MSLQTWKHEYYSITACKCTVGEALAHTYRKWLGIRPENLARHGVNKIERTITDGIDTFAITGDSCALCFYCRLWWEEEKCLTCPILNCSEQYTHWCDTGDPEPMIVLIVGAMEKMKIAKKGSWKARAVRTKHKKVKS